MISILCPTRGRRDSVERLHSSLLEMTVGEWELVLRIDDDDPTKYPIWSHTTYVVARRGVLSDLWNDAWRQAEGDIFMLCGDDIVFRTPEWDRQVEAAFPSDGIAFVYGDDGSVNGRKLGTHGFVSRQWTDAVGAFTPPHFVAQYADKWLDTVAKRLGRRVFVPILTEHMHPDFGKGVRDKTHEERQARFDAGNVDALWRKTSPERTQWVEKLRAVMA